jgi:hypothetical protein
MKENYTLNKCNFQGQESVSPKRPYILLHVIFSFTKVPPLLFLAAAVTSQGIAQMCHGGVALQFSDYTPQFTRQGI